MVLDEDSAVWAFLPVRILKFSLKPYSKSSSKISTTVGFFTTETLLVFVHFFKFNIIDETYMNKQFGLNKEWSISKTVCKRPIKKRMPFPDFHPTMACAFLYLL